MSVVIMTVSAWLLAACSPLMPFPEKIGPMPVRDAASETSPLPRLYMQEVGHGKPLLLLHGFGASSYSWRRVMPLLATQYRAIAVDMKGFGRSEKPRDDKYSPLDQAELLGRYLDRMGLEDVTVVGHSFGGGVALALALDPKQRKRIKRLILIDAIAYDQQLPLGIRILRTPFLSDLGVTLLPPTLQTRLALGYAYYNDDEIPQEAVTEYAKPLYTLGGKYAVMQTAAQIRPPQLGELVKRYKGLDIPTLVLWCEFDTIVPIANAKKLVRDLPKAQLKFIKDCGHAPQEERPVATANAILAFLANTD